MKKGLIYTIITALAFVTFEPVSKLIAGAVSPFGITFWRFIFGSILLSPFAIMKIKKEQIHIKAKDVLIMGGLGVLIICISMITLQTAVGMADNPALIAVIFSANSVSTMLFAMLILKEKMTKNKAIAMVLGVIGIMICADFKSGENLQAVMLTVISALTFSLYTILCRKYTKHLGASVQTTFSFFIGSLVLLVVLLVGRFDIVPEISTKNVLVMAYLAIFVTGIGYWSYFRAIEKGGAIMASLAFFIKPVLTPFATFAINGIVPDLKVFIAVVFIVGGSYFAVYKKETK
ncbi:MAG: EamA family transporter [Clostridia bacterium]|nr:EamA family transporter [Clostridia bacterium]